MAEYDLETARHAGDRTVSLRCVHVPFGSGKAPQSARDRGAPGCSAKSHDLIYLIKKSDITLPQGDMEFIGKINNASIPTRYPEDLSRVLKQYPEQVVRDYLKQTDEALQWLKQHPNLQK